MNKKNIRRPSYMNDDYSRFAGPDYYRPDTDRDVYPDDNFNMGEVDFARQRVLERLRQGPASDHLNQPGVSGKDRDEGAWFNESQYQTQKNFAGKGPKGYRRADARVHEEVCEALKQNPYIDATDVEVEVLEGDVYLRGMVSAREEKRLAERIIEDLPGVEDVKNELKLRRDKLAAEGIVKKQSRQN